MGGAGGGGGGGGQGRGHDAVTWRRLQWRWLTSPIRRQLKVIRVCLDVLAEQQDGSK